MRTKDIQIYSNIRSRNNARKTTYTTYTGARKAYKARMKYIEKYSIKNPNNPKYEMVILEKDGSLTLTGGSEKAGVAVVNRDTIKHQDLPYWRVIKANFDFYKKKNRKYYNLIVEFYRFSKSMNLIQCTKNDASHIMFYGLSV